MRFAVCICLGRRACVYFLSVDALGPRGLRVLQSRACINAVCSGYGACVYFKAVLAFVAVCLGRRAAGAPAPAPRPGLSPLDPKFDAGIVCNALRSCLRCADRWQRTSKESLFMKAINLARTRSSDACLAHNGAMTTSILHAGHALYGVRGIAPAPEVQEAGGSLLPQSARARSPRSSASLSRGMGPRRPQHKTTPRICDSTPSASARRRPWFRCRTRRRAAPARAGRQRSCCSIR